MHFTYFPNLSIKVPWKLKNFPNLEDNLRWKTTCSGRGPWVEDDLRWILACCLLRFDKICHLSLAYWARNVTLCSYTQCWSSDTIQTWHDLSVFRLIESKLFVTIWWKTDTNYSSNFIYLPISIKYPWERPQIRPGRKFRFA